MDADQVNQTLGTDAGEPGVVESTSDGLQLQVWDTSILQRQTAVEAEHKTVMEAGPEAVAEAVVDAGMEVEPLPMSPTEALTTGFEGTAGGIPAIAAANAGKFAVNAKGESRHGFSVGNLRLMIRYEDSSEISEMPAIRRLPNAPSWFQGVANLRGKLTPVFDLGRFLGIARGAQSKPMLLVLGHGVDATGVIIDGLLERLRLPDAGESNMDAAPMRLTPHLRSASLIGEHVWYDLDTRSLLGELERSLGGSS